MTLQPGTVVAGKYRIERALGEGGMGAVYAATNVDTQGQVALKVMHEELGAQPELARRFLQEAPAATKVRHPGVVKVFDAGHDGALLWIAMELLEGESLADRMTRAPLRGREIEDVFLPLLDVLEHVHRQGIVHRDLKPQNVFLERGFVSHASGGTARVEHGLNVRLLDFGIAKLTDSRLGTYATSAATFMGTVGYMSPEQMKQAGDVDPRTDLYAVGVMLYECISSSLPYDGNTFGEVLVKQHTEPPKQLPDTSETACYGPTALACLAVDREKRPGSAALVAQMLVEGREAAERQGLVKPAQPARSAHTARGASPGLNLERTEVAPRVSSRADSAVATPARGTSATTKKPSRKWVVMGAGLVLGLVAGLGALAMHEHDAYETASLSPPMLPGANAPAVGVPGAVTPDFVTVHNRFMISTHGTATPDDDVVRDLNTKREWQRVPPSEPMTQSAADEYCSGLKLGGGGWHLPRTDELASLIAKNGDAFIDREAFLGDTVVYYWAAQPFAASEGWYVRFANGHTDHGPKNVPGLVRCAR